MIQPVGNTLGNANKLIAKGLIIVMFQNINEN